MRVETVEAADLARHSDAIGALVAGELLAIVVRGLLPREALEQAMRRIDAGEVALPRIAVPAIRGRILGRPLVAATGALDDYLDDAAAFRAGCAALFGASPPLEERFREAFAAMAGGRAVEVPRRGDRPYAPATFRVLVDGDALPLHCENETLERPVLAALRPALDATALLSFYVPAALAHSGGQLRIYNVPWRGEETAIIGRLGGDDAARPHFERAGAMTLEAGVGDLLLFDGGRWYHEVTRVERGPRWTLGGFLALTRDGRGVRFWG
jgi:hypothetical protein